MVESPNSLIIYIVGKLKASYTVKFVYKGLDEPKKRYKNKTVINLINRRCPRSSTRGKIKSGRKGLRLVC